MSKRENGKIPLEHIEIYNDVYDLKFDPADVSSIKKLYEELKAGEFSYIFKSASDTHDYVLKFADNRSDVLLLKPKDDFAEQNGYKLFALANAIYYLKFTPKKTDLLFLNALENLKPTDEAPQLFNSIDELRDFVVKHDLTSFVKASLQLDEIEAVYWLCEKHDQFKSDKFSNNSPYQNLPKDYYKIIDVLQLPDDTRIALYTKGHDYSGRYCGPMAYHSLGLYIVTPNDAAYNWTDPNRTFSHISKQGIGKVFYADFNPNLPLDIEIITRYVRGAKCIGIENATLDLLVKREERRKIESIALDKAKQALKQKLTDKGKELATDGTFTFNDVTFGQHSIEYEGQVVSCDAIELTDLLPKYYNNIDDDYFNFESIFDNFCKGLESVSQGTSVIAKIGDVEVNLEGRIRTNISGVSILTFYVNGMRINKDEVIPVITRALCYNGTQDFENYVESVSKCSLRYHRYIAGGIQIKVIDPLLCEQLEFKIGLERDKNRNYISFGEDNKYPVKDTNKLLKLTLATNMTNAINVLLDSEIVGVTGKDIKYILETGKLRLEQERTKEKEMLSSAIKLFGCEYQEDSMLDNGRVVTGYSVKGKLRNYIVETDTLRVFEYPTGRYLCMVDKGQNEHANTARLVSRMFALANDSKLAKEITTLN